jgi:hypothetical protein
MLPGAVGSSTPRWRFARARGQPGATGGRGWGIVHGRRLVVRPPGKGPHTRANGEDVAHERRAT